LSSTTAVGYLLTTPSMIVHSSCEPVICSGLTNDEIGDWKGAEMWGLNEESE